MGTLQAWQQGVHHSRSHTKSRIRVQRATPADLLDMVPPWYFHCSSDPLSAADGGTAPPLQMAWMDSGHAELYLNNTAMSCTPSQQPVCPALSTPALWSPETEANEKVRLCVTTAVTMQELYTVNMDSSRLERGTVKNCKGGNLTQWILILYVENWTLKDWKRSQNSSVGRTTRQQMGHLSNLRMMLSWHKTVFPSPNHTDNVCGPPKLPLKW
jgi:hypothetical protein